jgi:hypothetical protein
MLGGIQMVADVASAYRKLGGTSSDASCAQRGTLITFFVFPFSILGLNFNNVEFFML